MAANNTGTFILNNETLTIVQGFGVRNVSILWVSGIVTVKGSMKLGARDDDAITLATLPLNMSFDSPIDGLVIDASAGQALLITGA
jgi:hypothetical protein